MSDSIHDLRKKLSFDVKQHPDCKHFDAPLGSSVKVSAELGIDHDLNPGEDLVVIVQNADGEVIASGELEVGKLGFDPIKEKGNVVGMQRVQTAKLKK